MNKVNYEITGLILIVMLIAIAGVISALIGMMQANETLMIAGFIAGVLAWVILIINHVLMSKKLRS